LNNSSITQHVHIFQDVGYRYVGHVRVKYFFGSWKQAVVTCYGKFSKLQRTPERGNLNSFLNKEKGRYLDSNNQLQIAGIS
jgi:hypothetical protein